MTNWPTDLGADDTAPVLMKLLGDASDLSQQAMYLTRACARLKQAGVTVKAFQVPAVGPGGGVTMPVTLDQDGNLFVGYTWYGAWDAERADAFLVWRRQLRTVPEMADARIVVLHDEDASVLAERLQDGDLTYLQQVELVD